MMFWINSGNLKGIFSTSMNGQEIKVLVDTGLDTPTGLSVDYYKNNRIYWCDQKESIIESMNQDGKIY